MADYNTTVEWVDDTDYIHCQAQNTAHKLPQHHTRIHRSIVAHEHRLTTGFLVTGSGGGGAGALSFSFLSVSNLLVGLYTAPVPAEEEPEEGGGGVNQHVYVHMYTSV